MMVGRLPDRVVSNHLQLGDRARHRLYLYTHIESAYNTSLNPFQNPNSSEFTLWRGSSLLYGLGLGVSVNGQNLIVEAILSRSHCKVTAYSHSFCCFLQPLFLQLPNSQWSAVPSLISSVESYWSNGRFGQKRFSGTVLVFFFKIQTSDAKIEDRLLGLFEWVVGFGTFKIHDLRVHWHDWFVHVRPWNKSENITNNALPDTVLDISHYQAF